jgi:hypothetical protein
MLPREFFFRLGFHWLLVQQWPRTRPGKNRPGVRQLVADPVKLASLAFFIAAILP